MAGLREKILAAQDVDIGRLLKRFGLMTPLRMAR